MTIAIIISVAVVLSVFIFTIGIVWALCAALRFMRHMTDEERKDSDKFWGRVTIGRRGDDKDGSV